MAVSLSSPRVAPIGAIEKVCKVLQIVKEPLSLETPIGDEEDSRFGDLIEDKNAVLRSAPSCFFSVPWAECYGAGRARRL